MAKEKVHLEYIFERVSTESLWKEISSPEGLSHWFSHSATIKGDKIVFTWDDGGSNGVTDTERMTIEEIIPYQLIRFRYDTNPDTYIEFVIHTVELTGVKALEITDFCDLDDDESSIELWDLQVQQLHRLLGAD